MAYTREQLEKRIDEAGTGRYEFLRWAVDGEFGAHKKCVVRCLIDGFEWSTTANSLISQLTGCPQCSGVRRWTSQEREEQIKKLDQIVFIAWDGHYRGCKSKVVVRCALDGFEWRPTVSELLNGGKGCPKCAGNIKSSPEERIEKINKIENIEFISWVGYYKNANSKVNVKCLLDGFKWVASVNSLVNNGSGCPACSGNRRYSREEYEEMIKKYAGERFTLVGWYDDSVGARSKVICKCEECRFEFTPQLNNIIHSNAGCPRCARYGYQLDKTGYLYALRSECGRYLKIGISNDPKRRHNELEKRTPFKFNLIEQISGGGAKIAELEKYFHEKYERAGFKGFDGATEWLICCDELICEIRDYGINRGK